MAMCKLLTAVLLTLFCVFSIGCQGSNAKAVVPTRPANAEEAKKKQQEALENSTLPSHVKKQLSKPGPAIRDKQGILDAVQKRRGR